MWASEYSLAALGQRTVVEALADGVPCKIIWRAVWAALELPARALGAVRGRLSASAFHAACRMQFEQTFGRLSTRGQDWLSTESRLTERLSVPVLRVTAQDFQTHQAAPEAQGNARRTREGSRWPRKTARALEAALAQIDKQYGKDR